MKSVVLQVSGMSCGHCVKAVTQVLSTVEGVEVKEVRIGQAQISMDPEVTSAEQVVQNLTAAGYAAVAEIQ
jgi:copper chaperone